MKSLPVRPLLIAIALGVVLSTATCAVPRESHVATCAGAGTSTPARLQATGWPATWWRQTSCEKTEISDPALLVDIVFWTAVSAVVVFAVAYARTLRTPRPSR